VPISAQLALTPIELPFTEFGSVRALGERVLFRAAAPNHPLSIVALDLASGSHRVLQKATRILDQPDLRIGDYLTTVRPVEFPTAGGKTAFGLLYPPHNPDYAGPADEKPPLLVKCHGGPTGAASSSLNLSTQFWTSRGIAVLDVNYGGSTGFGREYRERLYGNWGIVDVDDCVNGARFLAEQGLIDAQRAVITGGSAGGYTTLAALVFRDVFAGGASYYGVSDAIALARDTHKFESRYLDWLIGPLSGDGGALSRALAALSRGAAVEAGISSRARRMRSCRRTSPRPWSRCCAARAARSAISCSPASSTASARPTPSSAALTRSSRSMRSRCSRSG